MTRKLLSTTTSTVLPYVLRRSYFACLSSTMLKRSLSLGTGFDPESLVQTERNIQIIKNLVNEIINPTLSKLATQEDIKALRQEMKEEMDAGFKRSKEEVNAGFKRSDERMLTKEDFFKSRDEDRKENQREKQRDRRWTVGTGVSAIVALYAAGFFDRRDRTPEKTNHKESTEAVNTKSTETLSIPEPAQSGWLSWLPKL